MRLLLDTHALLWWLADDPRLAAPAREAIADPANEILVSVVSLWEIVVKQRVGKLSADIREVVAVVTRSGFDLLGVTPSHLVVLAELPMHHRDPFDHLLIAQAIAEAACFVTADADAPKYQAAILTCSQMA